MLNTGNSLVTSSSFLNDVLKFVPKNNLKANAIDPNVSAFETAIKDVKQSKTASLQEVLGVRPTEIQFGDIRPIESMQAPAPTKSLGELFGDFVSHVDEKQKIGQQATQDVLTGKSDNLHQAVLANQEAGVAFSLLLEIRNKLVDSFKELLRMQV